MLAKFPDLFVFDLHSSTTSHEQSDEDEYVAKSHPESEPPQSSNFDSRDDDPSNNPLPDAISADDALLPGDSVGKGLHDGHNHNEFDAEQDLSDGSSSVMLEDSSDKPKKDEL